MPRVSRFRVTMLSVLILVGALAYVAGTDVGVGFLTRDPNQISGSRAWAGLISTLGNALWVVAASISMFAVSVSDKTDRVGRRAFFGLGAVSLLFFLDDALLLHDEVLPGLGVHELFMVSLYAMVVPVLVLRSASILRAAGALWLIIGAFFLFGVSVVIDFANFRTWNPDAFFAMEDGSKFLGIALWADAIIIAARHHSLRSRTDSAPVVRDVAVLRDVVVSG